MAKVALICMYDPWALGLRTISNALIDKGHEPVIIHFKLPVWSTPDYFATNTLQYQVVHSYGSKNGLKVNHHNTDVSMWTHSEINLLGDLLEEISPDMIGISTRCVYEVYLDQIFAQIRRVKGAVTIAGGHDASFRPELYLEGMDYVCIGEGEDAMVKLADSLGNKKKMHGINNLIYKDNGKIIRNGLIQPDNDKDYFYTSNMNDVRHYLIENSHVFETDIFLRNKASLLPALKVHYYTMMGRGCVGKCTFCSAGQFRQLYTKNKVKYQSRRLRPINNLIDELKVAKELGYSQIYFLDSFFLAKKDYLFSFFEEYRKEVGVPFFAQFEPEQLLKHPEILDEAERAGFNDTVIGIQSGCESVNKRIFQRNTPHEKIIRVAKMMAAKRSINVDYHFITHNPFETKENHEETIELIQKLPKENTNIVLRPLYPFKNTAVENMISRPEVPVLDKEINDKLLVLYLIRYIVPDSEFEKVKSAFDNLSFEDLKELYKDLKSKYKTEKEWHSLGRAYLSRKEYEKAAQMFWRALQENNHYGPSLYSMAKCMFALKKYNEAIRYLETLFEDVYINNKNESLNNDSNFWYLAGECYYHLNQPERAIDCFSKLQSLSKNKEDHQYVFASNRLSWALSKTKNGHNETTPMLKAVNE